MIEDWVNDYVGIPYVVNGRDRGGVDCWGILMLVFREQRGIELPDWRVSSDRRNHLGELAEAISAISRGVAAAVASGAALQLDAPESWAIVTVHRHRRANHVGLCLDRYVLHCSELSKGVVCEPATLFDRKHGERSYWRWCEQWPR